MGFAVFCFAPFLFFSFFLALSRVYRFLAVVRNLHFGNQGGEGEKERIDGGPFFLM